MRFLPLMLMLALAAPAGAEPNFIRIPEVRPGMESAPLWRQNRGGFRGPQTGQGVRTVIQALSAWDGSPCVLEGRITERVSGEDVYIFQDRSGQILVRIEPGLFPHQVITPGTWLRISGLVDGQFASRNQIRATKLHVLAGRTPSPQRAANGQDANGQDAIGQDAQETPEPEESGSRRPRR